MNHFKLLCLIAVLLSATGCGIKGPLYLPDAAPVQPEAPAEATAPDTE